MNYKSISGKINLGGRDIDDPKYKKVLLMSFMDVKNILPEVGQTVDIYIKERNEWVRICDVIYLGEFEDKFKKHDVLNVFRYEDICGWTEYDISQEYTIQNDNIVYWSQIMYPE